MNEREQLARSVQADMQGSRIGGNAPWLRQSSTGYQQQLAHARHLDALRAAGVEVLEPMQRPTPQSESK